MRYMIKTVRKETLIRNSIMEIVEHFESDITFVQIAYIPYILGNEPLLSEIVYELVALPNKFSKEAVDVICDLCEKGILQIEQIPCQSGPDPYLPPFMINKGPNWKTEVSADD
jgi:hypothetical protein